MLDSLDVKYLYRKCSSDIFSFETTRELERLEHPIGQENALDAIDFATDIKQDGYNLFAMGPSGTGKHSTIINFLQNKIKQESTPDDWCYVNNFKDYQKPIALRFPPGVALEFQSDVDELIELLKVVLPSVFSSNEYRNEKESINQKYLDAQSDIFNYLQDEAKKHNVSMNTSSSTRVTFVPVVDGKVLSAEEFNAIQGEEKEKINKQMREFELIVKEELHKVSELNKDLQKEFKALDKKITQEAVELIIGEVRNKYSEMNKVTSYLDDLQDDVINRVQDFISKPDTLGVPPFMQEFYSPSFSRYKVNLFISNEENTHAPVIYENNPIFQNLVGKIEHLSRMGTLVTDFNMIKPGALHKANGGYLILDARKLLMQPFSYEELKRVLRAKEIRIESPSEQYSFISTTSLEPEPIELDIKVVLVGERMMYYLLYHYDPEFKELFKVSADFEDDMELNDENLNLYARMIGTISKNNDLLPLSAEAVCRVIEHSSRTISNSLKISTHLNTLADLLKESDYYSKKDKRTLIEKCDIEKALSKQTQRINRVQMKLYELIDNGTIMINISGESIGQINALSYISIGAHNFGVPSRITANTRIGKGEIIDIEREVELGGPLHSKGVMILSSYIGSKYAKNIPLSLSASLVFEQSYGFVDGDSASSTELYAILSSLSELPIKQNMAVTGSVNQFGELQAIGGVNEKIEGFFDICMKKDPNSFHGVIIPDANVKNLLLKKDIIKAAEDGKFAIYAVKTIDEGISILTGVESDLVNDLVLKRLEELSNTTKEFYNSKNDKG